MIRFLFICLLVTLVAMRDDPKYDQIFGNKHPTTHVLNQQQYWFDQIVDHYDYHNLILMLVNDFSVKKSQIVMNYRYFK